MDVDLQGSDAALRGFADSPVGVEQRLASIPRHLIQDRGQIQAQDRTLARYLPTNLTTSVKELMLKPMPITCNSISEVVTLRSTRRQLGRWKPGKWSVLPT